MKIHKDVYQVHEKFICTGDMDRAGNPLVISDLTLYLVEHHQLFQFRRYNE